MYRSLSVRPDGGNTGGSGAAVAMPGYLMASFYPMEMGSGSGGDASMDRALIASRNHREAEKRRRERIKSHLDRLRTILACDPKVCSRNCTVPDSSLSLSSSKNLKDQSGLGNYNLIFHFFKFFFFKLILNF